MAASSLKFKGKEGEKTRTRELHFHTSIKNIPPYMDFEVTSNKNRTTFREKMTCKSGFLAEIDHTFTIGFYWDLYAGLLMGVHFNYNIPPSAPTPGNSKAKGGKVPSINPTIRVQSVGVKLDPSSRYNVDMYLNTREDNVPSSWSGCGSGQFFAFHMDKKDFLNTTTAHLQIHVMMRKPVNFANLELARGEDPGVVQFFEEDQTRVTCSCSSVGGGANETKFDLTTKYFLSEDFSDARIECGDGTAIPVHRLVLTAGSEYFSRMFATDMEEAKSGIIKVNDFSSGCVKELLRFIYTGKSTTSVSTELFIAADKYGLDLLKKHCESQLVKVINVENAVEMYELGRKYGGEVVLGKAKKIIHSNKRKWINDEDTFKEFAFKYPKLMLEVFKM